MHQITKEVYDSLEASDTQCKEEFNGGRQINGVVLFRDASNAVEGCVSDFETISKKCGAPEHVLALQSNSILERVVLFFGNSDCKHLNFDCETKGKNQSCFDVECVLPRVNRDMGELSVYAALSIPVKAEKVDIERSVRVKGNFELVRGEKDENSWQYKVELDPRPEQN